MSTFESLRKPNGPAVGDIPNYFNFDHHGPMSDISNISHESEDDLKMLIDMLPKRAKELEEISLESEGSERMFFNMVKQSFRYMQTIIDLEEEKSKGYGSDEHAEKDKARTICHNATIDSINAWSRSLARAGVDNSFLAPVFGNRVTYGTFAIGLVLDIYTDQGFDILKYN